MSDIQPNVSFYSCPDHPPQAAQGSKNCLYRCLRGWGKSFGKCPGLGTEHMHTPKNFISKRYNHYYYQMPLEAGENLQSNAWGPGIFYEQIPRGVPGK